MCEAQNHKGISLGLTYINNVMKARKLVQFDCFITTFIFTTLNFYVVFIEVIYTNDIMNDVRIWELFRSISAAVFFILFICLFLKKIFAIH